MPDTPSLPDLARSRWPDRLRRYNKGKILYWQGDPVEFLYILLEGAVKISSIADEGKIHSFGFLGRGHLLGAADLFLDSIHETTAEVMETAQAVVVPRIEFQEAVAKSPGFSILVMQELATEAKLYFSKEHDLSFLDAQERLKQSLIQLAREHGLETASGVEIDINITHEDMGELINANRTTITRCMNQLKQLGYLRTQGRRIILIPIDHIQFLDQIARSIVSGDIGEATDLAAQALEAGVDPARAILALTSGMKEVDRKFAQGQIELNDVMWASIRMKQALPVIEAIIKKEKIDLSYLGRIVFGTVKGDIHDIGKTMVIMLLKARGFDVIDLGIDVSTDEFVEAVRSFQPDILAMSALLTTTQSEMAEVIQALKAAGLKDRVKIMIGGAPTTPKFAQGIGADGYGIDAREGVELAWRWCSLDRSA